jgi:transcription antitermination protein NusB
MENQTQIDELIAGSLQNWTFDRLPKVDRSILRIAVYELLFQKDVPTNVVLSEAVGLAESLSTAESSSFINGTLATISKKI